MAASKQQNNERLPGVFRQIVFFLHRLSILPLSPRGLQLLTSVLRASRILRRSNPAKDGTVRRILISYPYCNLGDLVLMLPMLEAVHSEWPGAAIEVVVNARTADLLSDIPFLDRVHCLGHTSFPGLTSYRRVFEVIALYRRAMMQKDYDFAITPRWGDDLCYGNYLVYLTGAAKRCGYSASVVGLSPSWDRFLNNVATGGHHEHESLRDLRVLSRTGLRKESAADDTTVDRPIHLLQAIAAAANQRVANEISELAAVPYAVISPGATHPRRVWPVERLADLIEKLPLPEATRFVIIGSGNDVRLCDDLVRRVPGRMISLAGKTNLTQLIALIANAVLFVGNDSGPAHIAGGLGIPTVVISTFPSSCMDEHVNSPVRFRPCGPRVAVVQPRNPMPPCSSACSSEHAHCITQVSVEDVLAAASLLIGETSDLCNRRR